MILLNGKSDIEHIFGCIDISIPQYTQFVAFEYILEMLLIQRSYWAELLRTTIFADLIGSKLLCLCDIRRYNQQHCLQVFEGLPTLTVTLLVPLYFRALSLKTSALILQ
ncbi:hypothetical protein PHYBLDRAFT_161208 [Phycomyces blakesleeanus NRRL 1555(-)]|uniref:Uncharacterized protein n=1 Tax=Phycomyces blakesleeanus (strain ATCC 8743b / DSM 1359 / FGSC 10004 / NBRC 33097 / NRRL 1555) TaxID=763407 RepID=A0A167R0M0_PHYB8|nr:hypothetical protein PHYBLDRAFT_161208 [Phycomyces blakesleeanus NRRL 1555(-)]OAD80567.1 hypothetical protein PHYBLDRAFT_161208 [Phycomyces blakesleeanus NRRL 1555(-)]|eukprot:XP_018298607.1 hypothetical protein PHYBLDRAFT_161208 [Phycomyces blakesleeanus NRRL 1555(-)]